MLEMREVNKGFEADGEGHKALDSVSLKVSERDFMAVVGRSGSGKSTLLNVLSTLMAPDTGEVLYQGKSILGLKEKELKGLRQKDFAIIFQFHYLLPYMTALENTLLPFMHSIRPIGRDLVERGRECLARVGLGGLEDRLPGRLSGGEQQRVAIARALVKESRVLFADEPTGSLDKQTGSGIMDLLVDLHGEGMTIVMVTHDLEYASLATSVWKMEDGRLAA